MANPTTYFGWVMPNSADLVTDLPADFNVFGQGVDTSMQFLLGGTTGQVLSKTSATNMAFTWIANDTGDITGVTAGTGISGGGTSGTVTVTNSMATTITTNGDLIKGTGSGTFDRLGIGSTGQVLTVAAGVPSWATAASSNKSFTLINTGGTALSGSGSVSITGISGVNEIYILVVGASTSTAPVAGRFRLNNDSTSIYSNFGLLFDASGTWAAANVGVKSLTAQDGFQLLRSSGNAAYTASGGVFVNGCNSAGIKMLSGWMASDAGGSSGNQFISSFGAYTGTSTISSVQFIADSATFDAGTIFVYGA